MQKIILALSAVLFALNLFGQNEFLRHYSINEGLPCTETYKVFEDSKGYIWIASDMGVSRFDGYDFTVYTTTDGLTDNTVFSFFEDPKGRIWFYTFTGRLCYFYNDSIYSKTVTVNDELHRAMGTALITSIYVDPQDTIYVGAYNGLYKIIPDLHRGITTWNTLEVVSKKQTYHVPGGYITAESTPTNETLLKQYPFHSQSDSLQLPYHLDGLLAVHKLADTSLIVSFSNLSMRIPKSGDIIFGRALDGTVEFYCENDSLLWIGQKRKGVRLFSTADLTHPKRSLLEKYTVTSVLKDRENGYWFTTLEDGLYYMPSANFNYYPSVADSVLYNETKLYSPGPGRMWILTRRKLFESNNRGKFEQILPGLLKQLPEFAKTNWWNGFSHSDGTSWLSLNNGIVVLNNQTGKVIKFFYLHKLLDNIEYDSRMLLEDADKNVWSLNLTNLLKINYQTKKIDQVVPLPSRAIKMVEDYNGHILISTLDGLYSFYDESLHFLGDSNAFFKNRFEDLKKCDGLMAMASKGAGLLLVTGDSLYRVTTAQGLSTNMCRSVCVGGPGLLWVATNKGLNAVNFSLHPFKVSIKQYTVAEGLLTNDIDQVVKEGDFIWLLSKKGVTAFNPKLVINNTTPPPVYITKVKINNELVDHENKAINYGTVVTFDFTGLTYKNAGRQKYKYRLDGLDKTWTYSSDNSIQFSRLPPGSYSFIVYCINSSEIESALPAKYSFVVLAPFYRKWWFGLFAFILATTLVILAAAYSVRQIRLREERKTELNRKIANYELQALRAQMNPHFIFNCLNAIQDFILKNEAEEAQRYLSSFSKLIRKTLDNTRRLDISLNEEIDFLRIYLGLERMRFDNRFSFTINISDELKKRTVEIPTMLIQPFAENAVRHGKIGSLPTPGVLNINFSIQENELFCVIEDNGIGINQSFKMKSASPSSAGLHAMEITSDRVRTINEFNRKGIRYSVTDKSSLNNGETGTRVEIYIPLI